MQFNYNNRVWDTFSDECLSETDDQGLKLATIEAWFGRSKTQVLLEDNRAIDLLFNYVLTLAHNEDIVILSTHEGIQHGNASPEIVMQTIEENDIADRELWIREIFEIADDSNNPERVLYSLMREELDGLNREMIEKKIPFL